MLENYNEILKPDEVCEILLIGKNTLYNLLNTKELILNIFYISIHADNIIINFIKHS